MTKCHNIYFTIIVCFIIFVFYLKMLDDNFQ